MLNVMLVDDEPLIKAAFGKLIPWEAEGFALSATASNGREALQALAKAPADIIITDLKMPQMDGIALIEALGAQGFDGVILVLSNYADFALVRRALVAGALDYMLKMDIDGPSLLAQLAQAKKALREKRKSLEREQILSAGSALMQAHALRAYLNAPDEADAPLPPESLFPLSEQGPFSACRVTFLPHRDRPAARLPSPEHVETVLRAVHEGIDGFCALATGERALLCLVPAMSLAAAGARPEDKRAQIIREIGLYFDTAVLLLHADLLPSLCAVRDFHRRAEQASALAFYALPPTSLPLARAAFGALPATDAPENFARRIADAYFDGGLPAVHAALRAWLNACRAARAHPRAVTDYAQEAARRLMAFAPPGAKAQALAFAGYPSEHAFLSGTMAHLEPILAQIIPPALNGCREDVRKALFFLHTHYADRITLDDVARFTNLDSSYICRLFKRETGVNVFPYLNTLRMDAAARLMASGTLSIRDISGRVGFSDPYYFTRLFKKHFGISPSEYRAQKKQDASPKSSG